eukprot:TRINITY_DN18247_c0_g1_i1.p1 TRINITY_DN18247_c0_g1~~TRINITY_DN18247_c0_g1_i1.p1  ORF type:complete len:246 (-),score=36.22 TRINITY_DN18247_c0_g1_i1:843-1580(-)
MALKRHYARLVVYLSNIVIAICGIVLLALGIWTMNDKSFLDELLRNSLYMNTAYIIVISSCIIIFLSIFGCFAAFKEVKCLLLTYFVFMSLLFVILLVGGILSYIFREQVTNTIQAEMIADIRNYNPDDPENTVTKAWDETQQQLSCCGLMTEQVSLSWEMWRYNKALNPTSQFEVVPRSCCIVGEECVVANKTVVEKVWTGDCMVLALDYVRDHSNTIGGAALTVCCFLMVGMLSALSLFKSII